MLKTPRYSLLRFGLLVLLPALLLGSGLSPETSLSASEGPLDEYAEPYRFTLSLPSAPDKTVTPATHLTSNLSGWKLVETEDFPINDLGDWSSVSYSATPADTWGVGLISEGNRGAWVRGGAVWADLSSSTIYTYTPNMDTWLVYGPLEDSEKIWDLRLTFDYFISLGEGDFFYAGYSTDGVNFEGLRIHSLKMNPNMWGGARLDWAVNRGNEQLWVAFGFTSNEDDNVDQGVWLDHLELWANYGGTVYLPIVANKWSTTPEVQGFYDDFSDPESGWRDQLYDHADGVDLMRVGYVDGTYRMKILLNYDGRNNRLMGLTKAPYAEAHTNYDVQVNHSFVQASDQVVAPEFGKAGLIFGANDAFSTIYTFEWNYEGNCAVYKYTNVDYPVTIYEDSDLQSHILMDWRSCDAFKLEGGYNANNHLLVEVRDNKATIYVMDGDTKVKVKEFTDDALRNHRRVGLDTGSWDLTPVESRFDNFWIEPVE
ncbi:MAG: hypothetical protein ACP5HM_03900 [Anaerolineae bacterium]